MKMADTVTIIVTIALGICGLLIWSWITESATTIPSAGSTWPFLGSLRSLTEGKEMLFSVYQKQLVDDQPYFLPGMFGDSIVLPPSMLPWLVAQPEDRLSAKWAQLDALNIPTTFLRAEIGVNPTHEPLVRRELTAHLDAVEADMWDEVRRTLEELWGSDTEHWRVVTLDNTIRRVVAKASNRVFAGQDLSGDNDFVESAIRYVTHVGTYGLALSLFPRRFIRRLAGKLAKLPIAAAYVRCSRHLLPMFEDLVSRHGKGQKLRPHLFASWLVAGAATRFPPSSPERTPDFLSRRLMALNFATVHTSTLTACNLLLDVFSGSPAVSGALRDEALASSAVWGPTECRRARLNGMRRLDSALRESMRLWGVAPRAMRRRVMQPGGVALPSGDSSRRLAEGVTVCISGWGLHHDERLYPRAFDYVHDRFMRKAEGEGKGEVKEGEGVVKPGSAVAAAVETDEHFSAWGIGKHACPGRFFAVDFVKIIMAHVLVDYEVEVLAERPDNLWVEYNIVPPPGASLSVRRRKPWTARR